LSFTFKSRDEILLNGGRLWRPRFLISVIGANNRIKRVKHGDVVKLWSNLGHHPENPINNH
jgi:hypothetical protein